MCNTCARHNPGKVAKPEPKKAEGTAPKKK